MLSLTNDAEVDGWVYEGGGEGRGLENREGKWGRGELLREVKEGLHHFFGASCGGCCCCAFEEKSLVIGHPDGAAAAAHSALSCPFQDLRGKEAVRGGL